MQTFFKGKEDATKFVLPQIDANDPWWNAYMDGWESQENKKNPIEYAGVAKTTMDVYGGRSRKLSKMHKIPEGTEVVLYRDLRSPWSGYLLKFPKLKTLQGFFDEDCFEILESKEVNET
ncbi:MAG: hypothetical protein ACTSPB_01175 [Candidatus Thorarchaeota archaeon]